VVETILSKEYLREMPLSRRRVTDPAGLKALAHPTRVDLLELLLVNGPTTATEAADAIGGTPANASWHLRKLAEHGFVREVTGTPGRSRPWRAVTESLTWDGPAEAETTAAAEGVADVRLERELQRYRAARASQATEPPEWREAVTLTQSALWLTAEETKELSQQLGDLFRFGADRLADPDRRPDGARLVSLVGWLVPHGPMPSPRREAEVSDEPASAPVGEPVRASPPGPDALPPPG
jgi:DNA-binding transcriptional ArsR family regulator